jgi:hypothetical protein
MMIKTAKIDKSVSLILLFGDSGSSVCSGDGGGVVYKNYSKQMLGSATSSSDAATKNMIKFLLLELVHSLQNSIAGIWICNHTRVRYSHCWQAR